MKYYLIAILILLLPLPSKAQGKIKVVASFSVIGDMVRHVAGDNIDLQTLVGENGNVHEYEPTAADARAISGADIVFINGLGLEGWIERLIESSGYKGKIITVSTGIHPINIAGHDDPHAWQDITNGKIYAVNIRDALTNADKIHSAEYQANTVSYTAKLDELDKWAKSEIGKVNPDKRKVISMHDAFQYFAARYGVKFIALLGVSTESEASAADMARIIDQVRSQHISAVFLENMTDSRLINQIERDASAHIGGTLYSDALSDSNGPASDYTSMFKHNVTQLVAAMRNNPEKFK